MLEVIQEGMVFSALRRLKQPPRPDEGKVYQNPHTAVLTLSPTVDKCWDYRSYYAFDPEARNASQFHDRSTENQHRWVHKIKLSN